MCSPTALLQPQDRVSQHSPHLLALLFFLYHLWRRSLSHAGRDRGPIYVWALRHLLSALGAVMHLCKDYYPPQKEVSLPRMGLRLIYGHKDLEGTLTTWSFRKTAVSGSFLRALDFLIMVLIILTVLDMKSLLETGLKPNQDSSWAAILPWLCQWASYLVGWYPA